MPGWLSRVFRREQRRSVSFQDYWGSARDVTGYRSDNIGQALQLVPVYAATRLLADEVASLPLQVHRQSGEVRTRVRTPELFLSPSIHGTVYDWVFRVMTSLTLRGNAYGMIMSWTAEDWPRQVEWLHPDDVTLADDRSEVAPRWFFRGREVDSSLMVHIPGYVLPGTVLGLSPIAAYAATIDTGILSQRFGRDWFANGSVPSGVLETAHPVDQAQSATIKERFRLATFGREPVVLGAGVTYKAISVKPEEAQFLATMRATVNQVASIYGIPPERIGGETGKSMTYQNVEAQAIDLVTGTLRPYLVKLEAAFSRLLPRPEYVRFNIDSRVRADLLTRYQAHRIALEDGWKSVDEVRALEDLQPLPDGQGQGFRPLDAPKKALPVAGLRARPGTDDDPPLLKIVER